MSGAERAAHVEPQGGCCAKPSIAVMDHTRHSPDDWWTGVRKINRCCTRCWTHWYGEAGAVLRYTRKEWDAYVGAVS